MGPIKGNIVRQVCFWAKRSEQSELKRDITDLSVVEVWFGSV